MPINDDIVVEALDYSLDGLVYSDTDDYGIGLGTEFLSDSSGDSYSLSGSGGFGGYMDTVETGLKNLANSVKGGDQAEALKTARELMKGGSADVQRKVMAALGVSFSGPANFKAGWDQIQRGLASGQDLLVSQGRKFYSQQLNKLTDQLPPEFKKSPMMRDLLAGAQDPVKLAGRVQKLSAGLASSKWGKMFSGRQSDVLKLSYTQAYSSITQGLDTYVLPFLSPDAPARKVYTAVTGGVDLFQNLDKDGSALIKKYSGPNGLKMDATGIANISRFCGKSIAAVAKFVNSLPISNSAKKVVSEITAWTSLATGCVSGIAAGAATGPWGAAAGAVACGVAILAKVLTELFTQKPHPQAGNQMGIFVPQKSETPGDANSDQAALAAMDATRLANLLREHYGFKSYKPIWDRLTNVDRFGAWWIPVGQYHKLPDGSDGAKGMYPNKKHMGTAASKKVEEGKGKNPTAYTMIHALTVLDTTSYSSEAMQNSASSWIRNLAVILVPRFRNKIEDKVGAIEDSLEEQYTKFYDVSVHAVEIVAALARDPKKRADAIAKVEHWMLAYQGDKHGATIWEYKKARNWTASTYPINLLDASAATIRAWVRKEAPKALDAYIKLDELLNFFAATTMFETARAWQEAREHVNEEIGRAHV